MIKQVQIQEQDVWEVWVEFDQFGSHFGILYVWGEYGAAKGSGCKTTVVESEYGKQLLILLPPRPAGRSRPKEYFYSEPIQNPTAYHSVCVYAGDELVARFVDIEIMI